ncbi:hypothetical protein, partial [Sphingopyxis terrae]|uniref:hypothetical protein n=1 Tax=Sphingopyxis terrae TaxID=33052 RepID=UPI000ACDB757
MKSNHKRILSDVLALEAWHDPFLISDQAAGVYVELAFSEARIGGESPEIPFTFKLALRRALLTVTVSEPLQIDRNSVARSVPEAQVEFSRLKLAKDQVASDAKVKGRISPSSMHLALEGSTSYDQEVTRQDQLKLVQTLPETLVSPIPVGNSAYSWSMEPTFRETLSGQPWNPVDSPRFKIKPPKNFSKFDASIKIEVTCALEDIKISDIVPKNP